MSGFRFPPCSNCSKFAGHTEGLCSVCYRVTVLKIEIVEAEISNLNHRPMVEEQVEEWIDNGVHSRQHKECSICQEEKELVSNFCCECFPSTCRQCNASVKICPYCRTGKYRRITSSEIKELLTDKISQKALLKVVRNAFIDLDYPSDFRFEQMVCSAKDITDVVLELGLAGETAAGNCELLNTIYCLCVDPWNIPQEHGLAFVYCYKHFGMEDMRKSYKNICEVRKSMDCYDMMKIEAHV